MERFIQQMRGVQGFRMFLAEAPLRQSAVLSVLPQGLTLEAFADALSASGIAVRAGLHCAPTAHETAGTVSTGTVRFSFSPFNTERQIDYAAEICREIMKNAVFF